jgi:hypothetical protein
MSYFDHPSISNSDLKRFKERLGLSRPAPENLQLIYSFGTKFHAGILEPHLITDIDKVAEEYQTIWKMQETFWKDPMCRDFVMAKDFKREHEFYDTLTVENMQIEARCKADGYREKMKFFLELKSTACETQKAFEAAMLDLDYDQACAHYMLTSRCDVALIVGISKRKTERLFKRIVKKYDDWYLGGEQKLIDTLKLVIQYSPDDVKILV